MKKIIFIVIAILLPIVLPAQNINNSNDGFEAAGNEKQQEQQDSVATEKTEVKDKHAYVDLGLSVLWAACNIGANRPEDCGEYYSWGETATKVSYIENKCSTWNVAMANITGDSKYDVAAKIWGNGWRTPSKTEIEELINNTTSEWIVSNYVPGLKVTSKRNGNSIFFPACGYRIGNGIPTTGSYGGYWSATPDDSENKFAFSIIITPESGLGYNWYGRYAGFCIRPIRDR